jgi:hypothetical protein
MRAPQSGEEDLGPLDSSPAELEGDYAGSGYDEPSGGGGGYESAKDLDKYGDGTDGSGQPQTENIAEGLFLDFGEDYREARELYQSPGSWRLHVGIAGLASLLSILAWIIMQFAGLDRFMWFTIVMAVFACSLSSHYYFFLHRPPKILRAHIVWFLALNVMFLLLWTSGQNFSEDNQTDDDGCRTYPQQWWFIIFGVWAVILAGHFTAVDNLRRSQPTKLTVFNVLSRAWGVLMVFVFILDLHIGSFPFWGIVLFATGLPLFWLWFFVHGKRDLVLLHIGTFSLAQLLFFFIWLPQSGDNIVPWWVFTLIGWGVLLFAHVWWTRRNAVPQPNAAARSPQMSVPVFDAESEDDGLTAGAEV